MASKLEKKSLSPLDLALLGGGEVAYIRPIKVTEAAKIIGEPIHVEAGTRLYCVCHADGTPLAITDSRAGAEANAMENDLMPISVH